MSFIGDMHKIRASRILAGLCYGTVLLVALSFLLGCVNTRGGDEELTVDEILSQPAMKRKSCLRPEDIPLACPRGSHPTYELWGRCVIGKPECVRWR